MRNIDRLSVFGFAALVLFLQPSTARALQPPEGFLALFNGDNLDGWWGAGTEDPRKYLAMSEPDFAKKRQASLEDIQKHWRVENGELVNDGDGLYLTTDNNFGDFELVLEYRTVAKADSGIYLKGIPQVQIWDYTEEGGKWNIGANKGSGGLWNNSAGAKGKDPLVLADRPFGEWNKFRIIQLGSRTWVWLNNQPVVEAAIMENYFDRKRPIPPKGPIQLQTHGGEIRWRNIFLREIDPQEANRLLRGQDPDGFKLIFNGRNLDGWKGAERGYRVKDGLLTCRPHGGGTLHTETTYGDFIARFEFRLPPYGNNGLAIRYPGSGDAAYAAMTELQILDNTHPEYASLDPRQYHGSAYGMVPAHRGYLRPVGEWNYQEVTVKGSTLKVELNGTMILDCDLADVTEYMGGKPHPGKDRKTGHFGFAGHSSPVAFRNIAVKSLD